MSKDASDDRPLATIWFAPCTGLPRKLKVDRITDVRANCRTGSTNGTAQ
jgi:hypothetical protein